jgi:hypothetical protein
METQFEVDIDLEKVKYEGEWLGTAELADKIRRMIDSQDFRIGIAGNALEYLQKSVANARDFGVKFVPDDALALERHSERAGVGVSTFIRQAVQAYMAAQPPLDVDEPAPSQLTSITTEPATPEDASGAVELTQPKQGGASAKVLVDPSLQADGSSKDENTSEGWFKKE